MINQQIQVHLPKVIELLEKHKVKSAYVFGSVLSERFNEQSDIDFLVNLHDELDPVTAGGGTYGICIMD